MANPFLFDCPTSTAPEVNPFLIGSDAPTQVPPPPPVPPAQVVNPFLVETTPIQHPGFYGHQQSIDAANPFAYEAYGVQQPPAQQYYGHYGQYTQVTATNNAQPSLSTAISPPHTIGEKAITQISEEQKQEKADEPFPSPPPPEEVETLESNVELVDTLESKVEKVESLESKKEQIETVKSKAEDVETLVSKVEEVKLKPEETSGFSGIFSNEHSLESSEVETREEQAEEEQKEKRNEEKKEENEAQVSSSTPTSPPSPPPSKEESSVGASLFGTSTEAATEKKLDLTAAAYADDEEVKDVNEVLAGGNPPSEFKDFTAESTQKISTGDAIFSDLPTKPDIKSTGVSLFGVSEEAATNTTGATLFGVHAPKEARPELGVMSGWDDAFDHKFESATVGTTAKPGDPFDPFLSSAGPIPTEDPFGVGEATVNAIQGFGRDDGFSTAKNISVVKKPQEANPFLENQVVEAPEDEPLFDDDTSQPLEPYPRLCYEGDGWEMFVRHPPKKKLTSQRFWKKCYVRLAMQADNPCVLLYENKDSKDPFQELPLQADYSLSDISHQVFDQYSKIFTLKLQYIFYKERAGIRPGQITKMQKLTGKIGFLAKAVEDADYEGVKEFASDMKKLGVPLEHAPQISELLKLGTYNYEDLKQLTVSIEEKLFRMDIHRDRALTYKTEEVQLTAVDEVYVEQDKSGKVLKQLARVRIFFCSFLTGMPEVELGVNDLARMGLEVVGRHDILPVPTEQWIRYEDIEFHSIIDKNEFEKNDHIIKFQPPDACYVELMRFRVRPPKARELPMQARCNFQITGNKIEIRADMMIPYHHTKAWGQVPCEDVAMRIPLPECWIYQFRTEKHHISLTQLATGNLNLSTRMGSVKSAHRRAGKVKGLERFLGTMETQNQELMETSSGQAKYEHQHKAIVWRVPRLPKPGQGSYTNHEFVCRLQLTSFDQMPETFEKNFYVEFTQPATCVSHTVLRSVSILNGSGEPPEKFAKYLARHEYKLEIEFTEKEQNTYLAATKRETAVPTSNPPNEHNPEGYVGQPEFPDENGTPAKDSDSDSD